jgi:hypothetical protein
MADSLFPPLPDNLAPTRATLHAYAHAVDALPRTLASPHLKWWHVSLKVRPVGLVTDPIAMATGGTFWLRMDMHHHAIVLETSKGDSQSWSMTDGLTGSEMADALIEAAAELGRDGDYNREKFEDGEPRSYDPAVAAQYFDILSNVSQVFADHKAALPGESGQIQLWPHNFDLAFEWFGTRVETHEENGTVQTFPSQLNLGFYTAGRAYFYSNPWPFDPSLTGHELPAGAEWHTEGWEGSILYYDLIAGKPDADALLRDYARAVFDVVAPTLTA